MFSSTGRANSPAPEVRAIRRDGEEGQAVSSSSGGDCALERALHGTATPIVRGGEIVDWYGKPDNGMLRFLLQQRLPQRYGGKAIAPGHPVWEAVRTAVLADADEPDQPGAD